MSGKTGGYESPVFGSNGQIHGPWPPHRGGGGEGDGGGEGLGGGGNGDGGEGLGGGIGGREVQHGGSA